MLSPEEDLWARMLARDLAFKAKELNRGMMQRVNRLPDIADFREAFTTIIFEKLEQDGH